MTALLGEKIPDTLVETELCDFQDDSVSERRDHAIRYSTIPCDNKLNCY